MTETPGEVWERLSRRQAAERLADLAYELTTGGPVGLGDGQTAAVPPVVVLGRATRASDRRVELELTLSWPRQDAA